MKYKLEFEVAKSIAKEVGIFLKNQTEKKIESLEGRDIKLELDRKSEAKIIETIESEFEYPILSEETGLTKNLETDTLYWIIDPIDGTMNFSRNNPTSCVSIALWMDKEPIFGVIYDFNRDELFCGYVGKGAWLNDKKIEPSNIKEKSQAILATGFPTYMSNDENTLKSFITQIQEYKKIRMIGSAALSLAYVACGRFDAYIEQNIKLWDIAAGVAINKALGNVIKVNFLDSFNTVTKVGVV